MPWKGRKMGRSTGCRLGEHAGLGARGLQILGQRNHAARLFDNSIERLPGHDGLTAGTEASLAHKVGHRVADLWLAVEGPRGRRIGERQAPLVIVDQSSLRHLQRRYRCATASPATSGAVGRSRWCRPPGKGAALRGCDAGLYTVGNLCRIIVRPRRRVKCAAVNGKGCCARRGRRPRLAHGSGWW